MIITGKPCALLPQAYRWLGSLRARLQYQAASRSSLPPVVRRRRALERRVLPVARARERPVDRPLLCRERLLDRRLLPALRERLLVRRDRLLLDLLLAIR